MNQTALKRFEPNDRALAEKDFIVGRTSAVLLIGCLISLTGCRSFSSTMLNRLGDNSFVGNSNGYAKSNNGARPFKGIPITLQVPSHLDVYIDEVFYLQDDGSDVASISEPLDDTRILNVRTELIKTKKVFTVDYKRPGSGTLNSNTTFSDEQYFKTISNTITDTTITDSAALLNTVLKGVSTSATGPTDKQAMELTDVVRDTRVVAFKRFDINDPDFELQVEEFVNQHLNNCDRCGQSPSYDQTRE